MRKYFKSDIVKLAKSTNYLKHPYVYFLLQDEEIVYVGYSTKVFSRMSSHLLDKCFNRYFIIKQPSETEGLLAEKQYIKEFNPIYNRDKASHETSFLERTVSFEKENDWKPSFNKALIVPQQYEPFKKVKVDTQTTKISNHLFNIPNGMFFLKEIENKKVYVLNYMNNLYSIDYTEEEFQLDKLILNLDKKKFGTIQKQIIKA